MMLRECQPDRVRAKDPLAIAEFGTSCSYSLNLKPLEVVQSPLRARSGEWNRKSAASIPHAMRCRVVRNGEARDDPERSDRQTETMNSLRLKNMRVLLLTGTVLAAMTTLVAYSPTLYRMFCDLTGYGGTVQRAVAKQPTAAIRDKTVTVRFDANVAPGLPWEFRPEQRSVETRFGEPTKVYYYAENKSDETIVARATFNVTPYPTAPYFFKIECFCFTEEKLGPGESARMPLVLYLDEQMLKDENAKMFREVTLSYTFFRQKDLSSEEIDAARDLKAGSEATDARLDGARSVEFENDAPRR